MQNNKKYKGIANTWLIAAVVVIVIAIVIFQQGKTQNNGKLEISATPSLKGANIATPSEIAKPIVSNAPSQITVVTLKATQTKAFVDGAPPVYIDPNLDDLCGNGICGLSERCDTCQVDCGCDSTQYCSSDNGICYRNEACGDNICTALEKSNANCCTDCGCTATQVCSQFSNKCAIKVSLTDAQVTALVEKYLIDNSDKSTIIEIFDTYYLEKTVKGVKLDCKENTGAWCQEILLIDGSGKVVQKYYSN
ncbi:MAG: hypothetical protein AABY04_00490 [Candidatus Micrarchaeota archaeon]